jgi:glutathione S-transferase
MKLYGSTTSPFVRRVRIVAQELGLPYSLTIVNTPQTEQILRGMSPLWKMPVVEIDGDTVFDSRVIVETLLARTPRSTATFVVEASIAEKNLRSVIDGALEAAIFVFYLRRDAIDTDPIPYCRKQLARIRSALSWVEERIDAEGGFGGSGDRITLSELALVTALDWMDFRAAYSTSQHPRLLALRERLRTRPSFAETFPAG